MPSPEDMQKLAGKMPGGLPPGIPGAPPGLPPGMPGLPLWVLSIRMSVDRRDILVEALARVLQPSGARKPWP